MTIRVALHHRTAYQYDRPITVSPQVVRLRPAPHCRTPITSYSLKILPEQHFLNWQQDPYGNFLARIVVPEKTTQFVVEVDVIAELTVINPFDFFLEPEANDVPFQYSSAAQTQLQPYLALEQSPKLQAFVAGAPRKSVGTVNALVDLNRYAHEAVGYVIRLEPGVQTCEETLTKKSGSCRDSAWLLVQLLRHLGMAARFVSGYLIQLKPDVAPLEGPAGSVTDFTDLHAWAEVFLPGAGWVGLDPTSGLLAGEGHLPLAATPDPESAAPITGATDDAEVEFGFEMSVQRIHEDPRVTKPYTEEQWTSIEHLGEEVDRELAAGPKLFTMGGEPTFVSVDDRDGDEWNTAALGKTKRKLAGTLFLRMAEKFATGPLLHFGQGKWYPGEPLPRWALTCYWRKDKQSIWKRPELIAEDHRDYGCDADDAQEFVQQLAERLHVVPEHAVPGYEDTWFYLLKERKLPVNVDPLRSDLSKPDERARLAELLEKGLNKVVGFALPLRTTSESATDIAWESGPWFLRQERMYLIPGDSPMGYRLPLDSLPWVAPEDHPRIHERDPLADRPDLPSTYQETRPYPHSINGHGNGHAEQAPVAQSLRWVTQMANGGGESLRAKMGFGEAVELGRSKETVGTEAAVLEAAFESPAPAEVTAPATDVAPQVKESASETIRTALCVEARGGVLHIFMPPVALIEEYLELIAAVEETAAKLSLPVRIEGYTPPRDYRVEQFGVTPDPGVIEVNLQPANSWRELVHNTSVLYEEARQSRLCTEKFMLDGKHTGTGGGNHIVLGGPTPKDSPFLRRPDLLRSLVAYWNNRPSLSYLFSGLFIGPTSQAPRADEGRHESIYELETACSQLPEDGTCPPWLVDRVFRHLLVDLTGNTHRAEFCIDKLYSPDSSTGRLGLVEMRGFEMPPHERMSLTQQLLVRALLAWFWKKPYRQPLVRWGTSLHDKFMLPHFVSQDFGEVLADLADAGFEFDREWFAPHFEFRYPLIGQIQQQGLTLEVRQAIEPWNVLGEEPGAGGTVRFVDSSVERVQVKLRGMTDPRHVLTCNGRRVPLRATGVQGEFVAGVRFRAWQPPSCLHPTIPAHAPLIFDLIDSWNQRSIGGCSWHVAHPGGLAHEFFPVNANVAESRRVARFFPIGHTPGQRAVPPMEINADYPLTLDLRRPIQPATPGNGP
ncbi:MAG: transglutaminase family protein [Planctomycetota bacterium]